MTSRGWCFTHFLADDDKGQMKFDETKLKYLCCQVEKTKEGKRHLQGYAEFTNAHRLTAAKLLLIGCGLSNTVHLEPRKGTPQQARDYCHKLESAEAGTFREWGKLAAGPGQRTDLQEVQDLLKKGASLNSIARACPVAFIKYGRGITATHTEIVSPPERKNITVHVLIGEPGSGKTHYAFDKGGDDIYTLFSCAPEWWDGYTGQKTILIDDFYGALPFERLLRILDRYPLNLPIKGGSRWAAYTQVFITSNHEWDTWYLNHRNQAALRRRINKILYFKNNAPPPAPVYEAVTVTGWGGNTTPPTPEISDDEHNEEMLKQFFDLYNTT